MKIKVVGSAIGSGEQHQFLLSYVCNGTVAIDAGSIGFMTPLEDQLRIRHVFLSHSHLDHTASLPIFLDNVYAHGPACPTVHAHPATLESLKTDFFNDRLWPDLVRISRDGSPFLRMEPLAEGHALPVEGLSITAIELRHVVPTFGFVVSDDSTRIAIVSDTGPSDRIWEALNGLDHLKAVLLEVSFPNRMSSFAEKTMHLTPKMFAGELAKLKLQAPIIAVHIKPAWRAEVVREVGELALPGVEIAEPGREYEF